VRLQHNGAVKFGRSISAGKNSAKAIVAARKAMQGRESLHASELVFRSFLVFPSSWRCHFGGRGGVLVENGLPCHAKTGRKAH